MVLAFFVSFFGDEKKESDKKMKEFKLILTST
jgi:hypothetical protein